jgi:hypothetical protein
MTTYPNFSKPNSFGANLNGDKIPNRFGSSRDDYHVHDETNNQDMNRFTYDNIIAHWEYIDKTVAKAYSELILKLLWSGSTFGELLDGIGTWADGKPSPGVTFIMTKDFKAKTNDKVGNLWLTCLPRWRLRRIESEVIKLLREYGWESTHVALCKGKEDEMVLEWEISVPAELTAQRW